MADANYRTSSFGQTTFATRTNTTLTPGVTAASGEKVRALLYGSTAAVGVTAPAGWVEETGSPFNIGFGAGTDVVHFYYLVAGGSEPSSYTWTHASLGTYGVIWMVQNVNTSSPAADFIATGETNAAKNPSASGTTSENNVLLFECFTYLSNAGTVTAPSGFTERGDVVNTFGVADKLQASAGATGAITYGTTVNDETWVILFGEKSTPAAGGLPFFMQYGAMNPPIGMAGGLN